MYEMNVEKKKIFKLIVSITVSFIHLQNGKKCEE